MLKISKLTVCLNFPPELVQKIRSNCLKNKQLKFSIVEYMLILTGCLVNYLNT